MKSFSHYLQESIIDPMRSTLSVNVFDDAGSETPKLNDKTRSAIAFGIAQLKIQMKVADFVLMGSILTHRYQNNADVDINVLVDEPTRNVDELRKIAAGLSGQVVPGTEHPINFHLVFDRATFDKANADADGVFDVVANMFVRKPVETPFDVTKYFGAFRDAMRKIDLMKAELKHDLIDYKQLKYENPAEVGRLRGMVRDALREIEKEAVEIADHYEKIKQDRRDVFARPLTCAEIREYGSKNRLPENVIYKLLEKHHYLDFLHKVEEIIGDDMKVSPEEADELSTVVENFVIPIRKIESFMTASKMKLERLRRMTESQLEYLRRLDRDEEGDVDSLLNDVFDTRSLPRGVYIEDLLRLDLDSRNFFEDVTRNLDFKYLSQLDGKYQWMALETAAKQINEFLRFADGIPKVETSVLLKMKNSEEMKYYDATMVMQVRTLLTHANEIKDTLRFIESRIQDSLKYKKLTYPDSWNSENNYKIPYEGDAKIVTLYHASVKARQLLQNGFSKDGKKEGDVGLGGSVSLKHKGETKFEEGVSFTYDMYIAKEIARCLKEGVLIAKGQMKWTHVREMAERDGVWEKVWDYTKSAMGFMDFSEPDLEPIPDDHPFKKSMMQYRKKRPEWTPAQTFQLYRTYLTFSPKRYDPVFFIDSERFIENLKQVSYGDVGYIEAEVDLTENETTENHKPAEKEIRVLPSQIVRVTRLFK